jgi:hypothetical protein
VSISFIGVRLPVRFVNFIVPKKPKLHHKTQPLLFGPNTEVILTVTKLPAGQLAKSVAGAKKKTMVPILVIWKSGLFAIEILRHRQGRLPQPEKSRKESIGTTKNTYNRACSGPDLKARRRRRVDRRWPGHAGVHGHLQRMAIWTFSREGFTKNVTSGFTALFWQAFSWGRKRMESILSTRDFGQGIPWRSSPPMKMFARLH